ncbi:MAG: glycosyltransferase [Planctomycetes bacterium]|nr:glycosyltransferase [Planctomycetota bacterium]
MRYLMVVPVPFFALDDGAAIESAFAKHLKELLDSLAPTVTELEVFAPAMSAAQRETAKASLATLRPATDRIHFTAAYPHGRGRAAALLGLPGLVGRLWRAIGRTAWVHAGASPLFAPFENVALALGCLRRRHTIYVIDIDHRASVRMKRATGAWSRGVCLRRRLIHDPWQALQHHLARIFCSTLFLKGKAMVRDYGRGRPHVHHILDCAHSADMLLTPSALAAKGDAQRRRGGLRACYFGRLVAYKGVDRMLRAVRQARDLGADVTFDVYGDGEEFGRLQGLAGELGLAGVARFHGARPYGPAFFQELAGLDLLLAAPLHEDTPRSAIDAQALGIGVLSFDTYYYADLASDGAGVVTVPWPDHDAMSSALVALAADRERIVDLGVCGVAFASANTQERWLARRAAWTPGIAAGTNPK